jgi:enoyl-CoA hydratase/carnithine racemase
MHANTYPDLNLAQPASGVVSIQINRPGFRNALNMAVRTQLAKAFSEVAQNPDVRAIVLSGAGGSFCGGADLNEMADITAIDMYLRHTETLWAAIAACPLPVIAAVDGYALGGGLELAMHADIIVADPAAKLGQPEVRVGVMPGAGGTQRLQRAIGKPRAMLMCLTGTLVTGVEAAAMGLVGKLASDGDALAEATSIATHIAAMPPIAVAQIKEVMLAGADAPLATALMLERKAFQLIFASADQKEGLTAFREKRKPRYHGK